MANNHTLVLFQLTKNHATRHWNEFANKQEAMDGICKMYELHLKKLNPNVKTIQYDVSDLFQYVDELADLSCLIYSDKAAAYEPFGREWIKKALLARLKSMSKPSQ